MKDEQLLGEMRKLKENIKYECRDSKNGKTTINIKDVTLCGSVIIGTPNKNITISSNKPINMNYTSTSSNKDEKSDIKPKEKQQTGKNIYRVEINKDKENEVRFYIGDEIIATVFGQENQIIISPQYRNIISAEVFLIKLQELRKIYKEQISLSKLEEMEQEREQQTRTKTPTQKQTDNKPKKEQEKSRENAKQSKNNVDSNNDIEISMDTYITIDKKISDIVPEIKEKHCLKVKIRSDDNINFEMYGIDKDGNEIVLTTLKQKQGTNPHRPIIETNADGTQVKSTQISTLLQINLGANEQNGYEGIGIKIGKMGIEEVKYLRIDKNNKALAVPVGLENTSPKYATKAVREIATKQYNPTVDDNIEKAEERTEDGNETTIENIDDNETNDVRDKTEIKMLIKAAKEKCGGMSLEEFIEIYNKEQGDTIQEKIDNAIDTVNEQYKGRTIR